MSKTDPAIEAAKPQQPVTATVTLETPLVRGDQKIERITLRKPTAGELRGVAIADLIRSDVAALHVVLPRITSPTLTSHDVGQLDLPDLAALASEVVGFFMTRADRAALSPGA
ncbi:phage tail assembly protein [Vulcaniibacterium tengchongense]|uniref:Tail assembly chaperone E/41/14-like protein n=1 Tax=Vulcaniibacterium tengchongense TaxID=1273429 RepID=A0A3N4UXA8_9GAMM|nr:phage tail assembly protein [Vulcaniibacterium tengchongense]RPE74633.1 tail assembly chaperone E/41/14-like protein [Vulcaniibacterium tengchongense]